MSFTNAEDSQMELLAKITRPGKGATVPGNESLDTEADADQRRTRSSMNG